MSDFMLTPAQQRAVDTRGRPVLVSAAAGSGKTRVLTERLLKRVREGEDVDRFLVITFTRAAAAELRGRILEELNKAIARNPGDRRLRRQSALLYRAQIGTIDSFCTAVVRENAHRLGISPGFSVLDEERGQSLLSRSLEEVLDRAYETMEEGSGLALLVDSVGAGRDDRRLADLVRSVYAQMQSRAFPQTWAREQLERLDVSSCVDAGETVWGRHLLADAAAEARYRAQELEKALEIMDLPGNEPLRKGYGEPFSDLALRFRDMARAAGEGWDRAREFLDGDLPRLGAVRKFADEATKNRVKAAWDGGREAVKKLRKILAGDSKALLSGVIRARPALEALMELVFSLEREYAARKRRADACDFSDVEHFCVKLLCSDDGGPTPLAAELSGRYAEVMVDEYQDVNAVQELIFQRVSGEGQRLFMVGDVKQSVYRFRLAEPAIFNGKYADFARSEAGERILLRENFRSRASVLAACNSVFEKIMSPELGEIAYDENARLIPGAVYPMEEEKKPELCLLEPAVLSDDEEETPDKAMLEARYVAGRIRAMVDGCELISDGRGGMRPVTWGDIAVLLRTPGTSGAAYRRALNEAGVPVDARQGGAFFLQPEVSFALSMLAVADNPRQDVPLIAAMRALPFGFTPDELTAVRARKKGDYWDALCLAAETEEKCRRFRDTVEELRLQAAEDSTAGVLRRLYDRTGLLAACSVMPDAAQRVGNLMQLYEYARKFEQDGNRGLFRFLSWLRALEERGMEPPAAGMGNAVQIMSIHKSKGLEFPVVFLADCAHRWNRTGSEQVLCHSELGLGMRMTDARRGVDWPTLPWRAIAKKIKTEELSEQERVLYVAMTRARERLIMTCVQKKAGEKMAALVSAGESALSPRELEGASSAAEWLMAAAARDEGKSILWDVILPEAAPMAEVTARADLMPAEKAAAEVQRDRLDWVYPWAASVSLPSKITATAVKHKLPQEDPEAVPVEELNAPKRLRRFRRPETDAAEGKPLTGAERGVAAHLVMQYIDFARTDRVEDIAGEMDRLCRSGFLTEKQAAAVPPEDIRAFFASELGRRLREGARVIREFRFSLLCPANTWYPEAPEGEEILLQGVVDCCLEEEDGLVVIDFKTDGRVEPALYTGQLAAYALAMERILEKPVKGAALWYLRKNRLVWVKIPEKTPEKA